MKQVTLKCLPPPLKRVMKAFKNIYQLTILREKIFLLFLKRLLQRTLKSWTISTKFLISIVVRGVPPNPPLCVYSIV